MLRHTAQELAEAVLATPAGQPRLGNTTRTVLITNARLGDQALEQLGRQVHASMARAIDPSHTALDGDILWAITTDDGPTSVDTTALGVLAAEVAWDAVLTAVR